MDSYLILYDRVNTLTLIKIDHEGAVALKRSNCRRGQR